MFHLEIAAQDLGAIHLGNFARDVSLGHSRLEKLIMRISVGTCRFEKNTRVRSVVSDRSLRTFTYESSLDSARLNSLV